jgi:hypothetical protein
MKTELRLTVAAIAAALPLLSAGADQTITFGQSSLPAGTVPDGYAGFDWHGAENGIFADNSTGFGGSALITEMSRTSAFDLDSMVVASTLSDAPSIGEISNLTTTISGYFNGTPVETLTENYSFSGATLTLNMDGVNDVKFETLHTLTTLDIPGTPTIIGADATLVTQMKVSNFSGAIAPELDPTGSASAVTLLLGGLLVIMGRRKNSRSAF